MYFPQRFINYAAPAAMTSISVVVFDVPFVRYWVAASTSSPVHVLLVDAAWVFGVAALLAGLGFGVYYLRVWRSTNQSRRLAALIEERTREVQESQERYRGLAEATYEAVVMHREGVILEANPAACEMSGYRREELIGMSVLRLVEPVWHDRVAQYLQQPRPDPYEIEIVRADGSIFPAEVRARTMRYQGQAVRVAVVRDLTERKQVEESLRKLSRAVENSHSTVVITGLDGAIQFANPAFTRITGYSLEEVLGKNPRILKSGLTPPEVYQDLWQTLTSGKVWRGELLNRKKDGTLYWENATISPVPDAAGNITHYVAIKEDITGRRRAEELYKQNQARLRLLYELTQKEFASEQALISEALEGGVQLTGSQFGYYHFVEAQDHSDGWREDTEPGGDAPLERGLPPGDASQNLATGQAAVHLFTWSRHALEACDLGENDALAMSYTGVWADSIRTGRPAIHNDYPNLPGKTGYPVGHPPLQRHMSVPIIDQGRVVVVCGVANKPGDYEESDALQLQLFMDGVWRVVMRQRAEAALRRSNQALRHQMAEIETLQAQLREQALRDPLTGAFNRRYLVETLDRELAQAQRAGQPVSLVIMDMDLFKTINDTYGHQAGDVVLLGLVQLLTRRTRKGDVVCRYGGEEFIVLLPGTSLEDAYRRAEEWRLEFAGSCYLYKNHLISTTISLGVAATHGRGTSYDAEDLLRAADQALYRAKHNGRNCTVTM